MVQRADWTFLAYHPIQFHVTEDYTHAGTSGAIVPGGNDTTFHNDDMNLGGQSRFLVPWKDIKMNFNGTYARSVHEQPTSSRFENVKSTTRSLDASFDIIPAYWLTVNITGRTNKNEVVSDVEATRNYKNYGTAGSLNLVYNLPVLGQFITSLSQQVSDNLRQNTVGGVPDSQNVNQQTLTTNFKRSLGDDFDTQLNVASDLRSTRYGDFKQNQDYLNRRLGGTLNFHKEGFPINMVLQASQVLNHTVFLDASRSGRNNTDVLYSIEYDINYIRNSGLSVTQSYIVSANSTVSDFEDNPYVIPDNRYIKSTNYLTSIKDNIFPRASVEVGHNLRLTRTGSYDLDPLTGQRLFGESSDGQTNDLTLKFNYRFTNWLTGVIQDRTQFLHQDNLDFFGNKVPNTRQRITDFNAGMNVSYQFDEHKKVQGTFSRSARLDTFTSYVNGTATKPRVNNQDYFLVQASLDIAFF